MPHPFSSHPNPPPPPPVAAPPTPVTAPPPPIKAPQASAPPPQPPAKYGQLATPVFYGSEEQPWWWSHSICADDTAHLTYHCQPTIPHPACCHPARPHCLM